MSRTLLCVFALAAVALAGVSAVLAQTATPASSQPCAVMTSRIGSLDLNQVFGPSGSLAQSDTCLRIQPNNPSPGDILPVGGYVIQGSAYDPSSASGPGIASVDVFLDDPNAGGQSIGHASVFDGSNFKLVAQIPKTAQGQEHAIFVSALTTSGVRASVAVPVGVGTTLGVGVGSPSGSAP
jgi:hypothetical protein